MDTAAAPAPEITTLTCALSFFTTLRPFTRPASVITAVPC